MNVDHFSLFLFCVVCSISRLHLRGWAKDRLWRRTRMKRESWSRWQNRYDGRWEGGERDVTVALGAVMFYNTVRGSVTAEHHMPPCDGSSSIPACLFGAVACLGLFEQAEWQVQGCAYTPCQTWHLVYTAARILSATPFGPIWVTFWVFRLSRSTGVGVGGAWCIYTGQAEDSQQPGYCEFALFAL